VDLVTLSACNTGLGETAGGEGLLGLQRAFQIAGAKSVLATLWTIDDKASRTLMAEFYENLWKRKMPKLEALRRAQLAMLRGDIARGGESSAPATHRGVRLLPSLADEHKRLPPHYWAAFVLSGDWR
jgi:CHAT domain-containing protein